MLMERTKESAQQYIWMLVTEDKYEFPIYICDSPKELAKLCGVTPGTVRAAVCHCEKENRKFSRYRRVEV